MFCSLMSLFSADAFVPGTGFRCAHAAGAGLRAEPGGGEEMLQQQGLQGEADLPHRRSRVRTANTFLCSKIPEILN